MKKLLKIVMLLLVTGLLFACSSSSSGGSSDVDEDDTRLFDPAECDFSGWGLRLSTGDWKYLEIIKDPGYTYTVRYTFHITNNDIGTAIYKSITEIYDYADGKQDKKEYTQEELDAMDYRKSRVHKNWNWYYYRNKDDTKFYCKTKEAPNEENFDAEIFLMKISN